MTDTLAAVVRAEPRLDRLPRETPSLCRVLIGRCLEKDLKNRLHDAADANVLLQESGRAEPAAGLPGTTGLWPRIAAALLVGCALGALFVALLSLGDDDDAPGPVTEFTVPRPEFDRMDQRRAPAIALSPDGSKLAYVATSSGEDMVFLRELGKRGARPIPRTERAKSVFFSPDGEWIGFTADDKLKKVAVAGQAPMTLADAQDAYGASWGEDDMIVYSRPDGGGLMEIPAAGGTPRPLTTIDTSEAAHRFPVHLPDDWGVLFNTGALLDLTTTSIMVKPREGEPKLLIEDGTNARYAPTGHLLYGQRGALVAVPFDLERLEIVGEPAPVLEGMQQYPGYGAAQFSISQDGTLAYVPGSYAELDRTLTWVDRNGSEEILPVPPRPYGQPRL